MADLVAIGFDCGHGVSGQMLVPRAGIEALLRKGAERIDQALDRRDDPELQKRPAARLAQDSIDAAELVLARVALITGRKEAR